LEAIEALENLGFEIDPALKKIEKETKGSVEEVDEIEVKPPNGLELYPFQKKGVSFIENKGGNVIIGDDMGLGKTAQALSWLNLHPEKRPAIIVVPASLKLNWAKECKMWVKNPDFTVLYGQKTHKVKEGIIIINYDILPYWVDYLKKLKPVVLICDEAQYVKNKQTKRSKSAGALSKVVEHKIMLTGTLIMSRPIDALNAIQIVNSRVFPSQWDFKMRYCDGKHNGFGWDFKGASNTKELHDKLTNTIMLRRMKSEVLKDLPLKRTVTIPLPIDNEKEYARAEEDFISWLAEKKGTEAAKRAAKGEVFSKIENLKQLAVQGKLNFVEEWVRNFLDSGEKLVLFCTHKFVVERLINTFKNEAVKVDGSVTGKDRERAVERFQKDDKTRLFIGNLHAAGVGITLTAASNTVTIELGWTPGDHDQAEDRIHRIGQEASSVTNYYLIANGTIEEYLISLIDQKRIVKDAVLDGKDTSSDSLLSELLKKYEEKI
jgi:SWI/SNF-related matrix-associated actin-dependent regulator 1 of chromatin subfamily A